MRNKRKKIEFLLTREMQKIENGWTDGWMDGSNEIK